MPGGSPADFTTKAPRVREVHGVLTMTSRALLLYAASAVGSTAASAFLLLAAASRGRGDTAAATGYNNVGFSILIVSLAVSIAAWGLLTRLFARTAKAATAKAASDWGTRVSAILSLSRRLLLIFWVLVGVTAILLLISMFKITLEQFRVLRLGIVFLSTCAAAVLLTAIANPAVRLSRRQNLLVTWAATALGFIAITGEGLGGWNTILSSPSLDWLTFWGYPLLNTSPLFGPMIAIGALLFSRSYLSLGVDSVTRSELDD